MSEPLPEEAEVPFDRLVANAKLLSQVGAALVKTSQQGLAVVPVLQMRVDEAWEAAVGAARASKVADDAATFVAACRTLGVRSVECCSALDITHPGSSSTRAVCAAAVAFLAYARCLTRQAARAATGVRHAARAQHSLQGTWPARRAVSSCGPVVPQRGYQVRAPRRVASVGCAF